MSKLCEDADKSFNPYRPQVGGLRVMHQPPVPQVGGRKERDIDSSAPVRRSSWRTSDRGVRGPSRPLGGTV